MSKKLNVKAKVKVVAATATAIFTLASTFTATYAWFMTNNKFETHSGSFSVKGREGIDFDIYYLSSFTDSEDIPHQGNYNSTISSFSGYENEYEDASFTKVNVTDGEVIDVPDPTNISHLWPAHKLTYAIVISSGTVNNFSLINWNENEGEEGEDAPKTSESQYVRFSWAIDIFGKAYSVAATNDVTNDISTGFASYYDDFVNDELADLFDYSESHLAPISPKTKIDIVNPVPPILSGYRVVIFFTISFSDDESTYYAYNSETGYYVKNTSGNSNCYEGLQINDLEFSIE